MPDALRGFTWLRQPSCFALVGVFNTVLDFAIFSALVYGMGLPAVPSNVSSYSAGVISSFALNRRWSFATATNSQPIVRQFAKFLMVTFLGLALSTVVVWGAGQISTPLIAKSISILIVFIWNYQGYARFVFRE